MRFLKISMLLFLLLTVCGCDNAQMPPVRTEEPKKNVPALPDDTEETLAAATKPLVLRSGYVYVPDLILAHDLKIGPAFLRRIPGFQVEIFCKNGVLTALPERFSPELLAMLPEKAPQGFPMKFLPPEKPYQFWTNAIHYDDMAEVVFGAFGEYDYGSPSYNPLLKRAATEFYWSMGDGVTLCVVESNGRIIEKLLLTKKMSRWR